MKMFSQGTETWKNVTQGSTMIAYSPLIKAHSEAEIVEPGTAVPLSSDDRKRLNRSTRGVQPKPERI